MCLAKYFAEREQKKTLKKIQKTVDLINAVGDKYKAMSDEELRSQTEIL